MYQALTGTTPQLRDPPPLGVPAEVAAQLCALAESGVRRNAGESECEGVRIPWDVQTVEDRGRPADMDPLTFVDMGLGQGKHIQLNRHKATLDAIAADPTLLAGTEVKGIASGARYTVTLPKMSGPEVDVAVKAMQDAFKSRLGIDVTFKFSSASVKDVQSALAALGKAVR